MQPYVSFSDVFSLPVPEFIDPVFVKTSPKRSFSITENEHFGLVFMKTESINSGTVQFEFFAIFSYCLHFAKFVCLLRRLQRLKQEWQKSTAGARQTYG